MKTRIRSTNFHLSKIKSLALSAITLTVVTRFQLDALVLTASAEKMWQLFRNEILMLFEYIVGINILNNFFIYI